MAFTEFYCDQTNGSNLNAGSANAAATYTSAAGDSDGTSVFTPNDGSTPANTVSVGMFGSVYVTAGATVATFVGRVTVVAAGVNGAITFSTTAKSGTFPASSAGAHTITCIIGGYWKGPNGATGFPFNFITNALTDSGGDTARVNFKSGTNFAITAAITHANVGPLVFQGFTTSAGDGGRAIIDGGTSGASYVLFTCNQNITEYYDLTFQNNGASGSATGVVINGANRVIMFRCIVNSIRGYGLQFNATSSMLAECEFYTCNQSNTSALAGVLVQTSTALRCYSHDNTGSNSSGFLLNNGAANLINCISDSNGQYGASITAATQFAIIGCDFYNNGSDGIRGATTQTYYIENSNFVKNGGYGFNGNTGAKDGLIMNCGFGSGTQVNTSGQTNALSSIQVFNSVTYASGATPWQAPTTGNFSIVLAAAENAGLGVFTETGASKSGTVGYPDIGAAQHNNITRATAFLG